MLARTRVQAKQKLLSLQIPEMILTLHILSRCDISVQDEACMTSLKQLRCVNVLTW